MLNSRIQTKHIPATSLRKTFLQNRSTDNQGESSLTQMMINIRIRGIIETLKLLPYKPFYIGRFSNENEINPDLDLSCFGAEKYGVSRIHACLQVNRHQHLYIQDLDSTNGTYLNGERLAPYVSTLVRDNDEVILGNFLMRICFEVEPEPAYA